MFNTTDSVPRSEGKVRPLAALKRLARKLNVEIKFAEPGIIHERYAPESKYNISASGRKIKQAAVTKVDPMQVYTGGRSVRWYKTEGGFKEPVVGEPRGKPATRLKALRPLAAGQAQQYAAPKGKQWVTVKESDIRPGEVFKDVPVYERQRMNWKKYVRAQAEIEKIPTSEVWGRHRQEVQERYSGERVGPRELRSKTVQHIQGQMKLHRDYMAGEARESLAIIRAKNASLESARAHPERMVEYKRRLSDLAKQQQEASKTARTHAGERLSRIATRGMTQVAEEHQGDWQSKLSKLHKQLQAAASPEEVNEVQKQIHQHFLIRKSPEDIKSQARGAMGLITDKPYEYGGTPLSEISISSIQDILQKGSRTSKPITAGRVLKLKRKMDEMYERSKFAGLSGVKKKILTERKIFTTPIAEAATGYPHLGKLGIGIGAAGLLAGGALAIHAARKRRRTQQMRSRLKEIRLALPGPEEKKLTDYAKRIFAKAEKSGFSTSTEAIPGTTPEVFKPKTFSISQIAHRKWQKFIRAAGGSKVQDLKPMDMKALRALQETHEKNLGVIKTLREQVRTKEHLGEEALKAQAEKLGAEHATKQGEIFKKGHKLGREEGATAARSTYERQAGELTERLGQESARRAGKLKLIAAGTLAGGAVGGYALGRYDKRAHERHEAREILNLYKPRQPRQPAQQQNRPMITIGISSNGGRRKNVEFQERNDQDEGPEWLRQWAHKKLYGRDYNTIGQAQRLKRNLGRTHRIVRDLNIKRQGLPNVDVRGRPRKNEWERPWVANALILGSLATGVYGAKKGLKFIAAAHPSSRIGQLREGFMRGEGEAVKRVPGLGRVGGFVHGIREELTRWRDKPLKTPLKYEYSKFNPVTGKMKTEAQIEKEIGEAKEKEFFKKVAQGKTYKEEFRSRLREIRFQINQRKQQDETPGPTWHDIATGSIEGGLGFIGTDQLLKKVAKSYPIMKRPLPRFATAVGVGGLATGTIGYGLNRLIRKKIAAKRAANQQLSSRLRLIRFQDPYYDEMTLPKTKSQRTLVARDRYMKQIHERDIARADRLYKHTALIGAGIGALATRKPAKLLRSAGIGAAAGIGVQKVARLYGESTRDPFGERTVRAKRVEQAPEVIGTAALAGYGLKRLSKYLSARNRVIRFERGKYAVPLIKGAPVNYNSQMDIRLKTAAKYRNSPHGAFRKWAADYIRWNRIYGKKYPGWTHLGSKREEIRFEEQPQRKHRVLAGLAVASAGIPLYRGAGKFARIGLRSRIDKLAGKSMNYGKQVADYLEASQHILNQGVTGKVMGAALRHPESAPVKWAIGKSPKIWDVGSPKSGLHPSVIEHYSAFRHSPTSALDAWHKEAVSEWRGRKNPEVVKELNQGRKVLSAHLQDLRFRGYNEREALREATKEPLHSNYFRRLIAYKGNPIKNYQKVTAGLAAVPATAGLAVAATKKKNAS